MGNKRELRGPERLQAACGCGMLCVAGIVACLGSIAGAMCETTVFQRSLSPSGLFEARVEMTDCGALSGFTRVVWLQPTWLPRTRWLSCRAVAFDGMAPVQLKWQADAIQIASAVPAESIIGAGRSCHGWRVALATQ